jgi:hypothetical protein
MADYHKLAAEPLEALKVKEADDLKVKLLSDARMVSQGRQGDQNSYKPPIPINKSNEDFQ